MRKIFYAVMGFLLLVLTDAKAGEHLKQIGLGFYHGCALSVSGKVKCWGYNGVGSLGLGDELYTHGSNSDMGRSLPYLDLSSNDKVTSLATGYFDNCALFESGKVKCWGYNNFGELGLGKQGNIGKTPDDMGDKLPYLDFGTTMKVTALAATYHVCAVFDSSKMKCWGRNDVGQLGLGRSGNVGGSPTARISDLPFLDLGTTEKILSIALGETHTCALFESGRVKCWGSNSFGQLGLEDTRNRGLATTDMGDKLPFIDLGTTEKVIAIQAGGPVTFALFESGRVKGWGANSGTGQLGLEDSRNRGGSAGDMGEKLPFIDFGTTAKVVLIKFLMQHGCVVFETGQIKCWGSNGNGELGLGDTQIRGAAPKSMGINLPFVPLGNLLIQDVEVGYSHTCVLPKYLNAPICWGDNNFGQLGLGNTMTGIGSAPDQVGENSVLTDIGF